MERLTSWRSEGAVPGQFYDTSGIAIVLNGNVLVADGGNDRIQEFTSDDEFAKKWGSSRERPG